MSVVQQEAMMLEKPDYKVFKALEKGVQVLQMEDLLKHFASNVSGREILAQTGGDLKTIENANSFEKVLEDLYQQFVKNKWNLSQKLLTYNFAARFPIIGFNPFQKDSKEH